MAISISSVKGKIANGSTVTVTGTDFGATGPVVDLFDDFEKGTNGNALATTSGSAQVNEWSESDGGGMPLYGNGAAHSGSLALFVDRDGSEGGEQVRRIFASGSQYVFQCWWVYLPAGNAWPAVNWKLTWIGCDLTTFNVCDYTAAVMFYTAEDQGNAVFSFGSDDNTRPTRYGYVGGVGDGDWTVTTDMQKGVWVRHAMYCYGHPTAGIAQYWETGPSGTRTILNESNKYTADNGYNFLWLNCPGYGGQTGSTGHLYYDDVYIATGSGARARIEIGNNATYANCTNLAICTPTSWADGSVTFTVRAGSFTTGDVYLFAIDASGNVSSGSLVAWDSVDYCGQRVSKINGVETSSITKIDGRTL